MLVGRHVGLLRSGHIDGFSGSEEAPAPLLAFNEAEVVVEVTAPNEDGQFDSSATADRSAARAAERHEPIGQRGLRDDHGRW